MHPGGKCIHQAPFDKTGWSLKMLDCVPYVKSAQSAVFSQGKPNGLFLSITLRKAFNFEEVKLGISQVPKLTNNLNEEFKTDLVSVVAIADHVWRYYDSFPPKELRPFTELHAKNTKEVLFPTVGADIFLFAKSSRMDVAYELSKLFLIQLGKSVEDFDRTQSFAYMPTTEYEPNLSRDLTGFIDGTRNPDHLLRAIVDEVLIFPGDDEKRHVGGCYMYTGKFVHDLEKFRSFSDDQKSQLVGRDFAKERRNKGYDHRPENPRLDDDIYRSKNIRDGKPANNRFHTNRGHAAIYRQSMPFFHGNQEGLNFIAFSRFISEFDNALKRMCGHYQPDGSTDGLFEFTRATTSGYYYVPSLEELELLASLPVISNPPLWKETKEEEDAKKLRIFFEYCTNCGYKTIFLEKLKVIMSFSTPERPIEIIPNPQIPRVASFEIYTEDGKLIWSKLAQVNGMNNYPECFPTNQKIVQEMKQILDLDDDYVSEFDVPGLTRWGDF